MSQLRLRVSGECEGSVAGHGQIAGVNGARRARQVALVVFVPPEGEVRSVPDQRANRAGRLAGWMAKRREFGRGVEIEFEKSGSRRGGATGRLGR